MKKILVLVILVIIAIAAKLPKSSKAEIARRGFTAAINKDTEAFVKMCDDNVVISIHSDDSDIPKETFKGKQGAREYMERRKTYETYNFTNMQFKELGEKVIVTGHFEGKLYGKPTYTNDYAGIAIFNGDKIQYYYAF